MPEYLAPGVFIEEIERGPKPIEGVSTSNAGFLGATERGPEYIKLITSWIEFQRLFVVQARSTHVLGVESLEMEFAFQESLERGRVDRPLFEAGHRQHRANDLIGNRVYSIA